MAMIDYGAIAFKNGKLISTSMFTPMIDMVGWEDSEDDLDHHGAKLSLKGNYFAYIGDSDYTLCFYKTYLKMVEYWEQSEKEEYYVNSEWLDITHYKWSKWSAQFGEYKWHDNLVVKKKNGYYVCRWKYKGDRYKVYFGYGVDLNLYKKTKLIHFVNYFRLPQHVIKKFFRELRDKIEDWNLSK